MSDWKEELRTYRPKCAKCRKPVRMVLTRHDPRNRVVILSARCHGECDEIRITEVLLAHAEVSVLPEFFFCVEGETAEIEVAGAGIEPAMTGL